MDVNNHIFQTRVNAALLVVIETPDFVVLYMSSRIVITADIIAQLMTLPRVAKSILTVLACSQVYLTSGAIENGLYFYTPDYQAMQSPMAIAFLICGDKWPM